MCIEFDKDHKYLKLWEPRGMCDLNLRTEGHNCIDPESQQISALNLKTEGLQCIEFAN